MFKPVSPQVDFPKLEEEILAYWKKNKIFEKTLAKDSPGGNWNFLDGPPFITGSPHYGTLLSSIPKDVFGRYWTMKGYHVRRVWGWDGHGLPIENKVEGELGIASKKEIETKIGVKKFIERCLHYVNDVSSEWEWYIDHIGRWVDFKNAYKTWEPQYMETVMWVFKQMYEKGLIYKGLRVLLYCPHCATPISNFEVAMDADNYKMKPDRSTVYKYELKSNDQQPKTYLLAWSTTPWNKIVTPALAVNPKLEYVEVAQGNERYILAKARLSVLVGQYKVINTFKGKELIGKEFVGHYTYYPIEKDKRAFVVIPGDFVTAQEGTGIVTMAAYGFDDLLAMQKNNIHVEMHLDEEGNIKKDVPKFGGLYYLKANKLVNEDLAARGLLYKDEEVTHSVPTCWRCGTRLYQAPQDAWYVAVAKMKDELKKTNEKVNWFPKHFKYGRFLKSLESAPDWNISRNRYWGSPVPVWECAKCGERFVPGSIKELEERSGTKITDLHKPGIDEVTIICEKCGNKVTRVAEVLDSWIEAGSASFAERHFPFDSLRPLRASPSEMKEKLKEFFPPDFITEYTGQIRAWFYVLAVIANALYQSEAFKNVLVTGVILGTDGRKMSKNYKNYPDPKELLQKYGGDALRLYLLSTPVMRGEDIVISEEAYREQVRGLLLIYWNVYNFLITNARADKWEPTTNDQRQTTNILDRWILSRLHGGVRNITKAYDTFDTPGVVGQAWIFMQDLSLWYVRRSRDRVGPTAENEEDKENAYQTLWTVLTEYTKALASLIPFTTEEIYRNLTGEESVHLADWPKAQKELSYPELESEMENARKLASVIHAFRKQHNVKVRIPLKELAYKGPQEVTEEIKKIVLDEVNVEDLRYIEKTAEYSVTGDTSKHNQDIAHGEAREIVRSIQAKRKELKVELTDYVTVTLPSWPKEHEEWIKKQTLARELKKGHELDVAP